MSKNTNLSFLTDYITADITNGRIGINNASPAFAFDVTGATRFQGTTASDTAPLGSELAGVTGSGTNWALAGGATNLNIGGYVHTVGSVVPLTTSLAAVNGTYYQITFTITGRTAGSITIAYGGTNTFAIATGATGPKATATTALTITPTNDFDGTIVLSIKSISLSSASSTFANSSGTSIVEIRANSSNTNTFIGLIAGGRTTTGINNIFIGTYVGVNNTTGTNNTFLGYLSGNNNTTGGINSFFGLNAGYNNTTASNNSFFGGNAGLSNTTGENNTFVGTGAGQNNTIAVQNTFVGANAGQGNTTGSNNTFIGQQSGVNNTTGFDNSFFGFTTGFNNTTGSLNTFIGRGAGFNNTTGSQNTIIGYLAGRYIANGSTSATIIDNSIMLGYLTKPLADNQTNQIVIGYNSTGLGSNTTVLGNSSTTTTAIYGNLGLGTTTPSARLHTEVAVEGTGTGAVALIAKTSNGVNDIFRWFDGATQLGVFKNNGNVGIGTTDPQKLLHIANTSAGTTTDALMLQNGGNTSNVATGTRLIFKIGGFASNQINTYATIDAVINGESAIDLLFKTPSYGILFPPNERMRITGSGNVGIGTSNPSQKLEVGGTVLASSFLSVFSYSYPTVNVWTTFYTMASEKGIYSVIIGLGQESFAEWQSYGVVFCQGSTGVFSTLYNSSLVQMRLSGLNIQVLLAPGAGFTRELTFKVLRT